MTPHKINPPHYFLGSLVLMAAVDRLPWGVGVLPAPWPWIGIGPVVAGITAALLAARQFAAAGTNIVPLTESTALVTDGMFAHSRNPMYLGMVFTLVGVALLLNSALPWLVVVGFVIIIKWRFIRHEEALMQQTFGDRYRQYCARVRRWM
jgi:protein-S-isoprenylcysteine O-methyltransferase Ste14